ncbi:MAG: hypothetical protein FJX80_10250 [Bacteroidetes bacterium]|nr:hypothetical protein [Bacteroidota bacterium]
MNREFCNIENFSPHLFWDLNKSKLDFEKSKSQIIFQVVEYGLMSDWLLIQKIYSREEIKEVVTNLRNLDKVTFAYLAHFFQLDKTQFRCYTISQSAQSFWNS